MCNKHSKDSHHIHEGTHMQNAALKSDSYSNDIDLADPLPQAFARQRPAISLVVLPKTSKACCSPVAGLVRSGVAAAFAHLLRSRLHRCSTSRCPVTNTRMPPGGRRSCIWTTCQMEGFVVLTRHSDQKLGCLLKTVTTDATPWGRSGFVCRSLALKVRDENL